jgi:hypothetical protein
MKNRKRLIDGTDTTAALGAALLGFGLWQIYPPVMFIVIGVLLLGVTLFGLLRREK